MEDLTKMDDNELIQYYFDMQKHEEIEHKMDGSGELGSAVTKAWAPVWDAFDVEFDKRHIQINNSEKEIPY